MTEVMNEGSGSAHRSIWSRLYHGETTFDFVGKRWYGFSLSLIVIVLTLVSLFTKGLNLGIDFEGGVAWEVPAKTLTIDDAKAVLEENGIDPDQAKVHTLSGSDGDRLRIQVGDQPEDVASKVQEGLAKAASEGGTEVSVSEVSQAAVSSSWGRSITEKAIRALIVFFVLVSLFIAWRFEWRMAISAIVAMAHDVLVSVGVYSLLGFEVTPATVVAFLTILGFSLYDTIVVFDKVHENAKRFSGAKVSYADITNLSMNQVLMRSLNTSLAAVLPVLSLLILGSGVMGAVALREFALALLVGMATGAYSSIYIATPMVCILKERSGKYASLRGERSLGEDMTRLAVVGTASRHRSEPKVVERSPRENQTAGSSTLVETALTHPPRPRKKKRR
jgi:preprotein translocase subunit SecF